LDGELDNLIARWRRCAQKGAERVFVDVKGRIERMGGWGEYRKREREREHWREDGSQCEDEEEKPEEDDDDEGDEFTMEYMLKIAGISEELIGWDRSLNNFLKT
jgi:hypothetical protein